MVGWAGRVTVREYTKQGIGTPKYDLAGLIKEMVEADVKKVTKSMLKSIYNHPNRSISFSFWLRATGMFALLDKTR